MCSLFLFIYSLMHSGKGGKFTYPKEYVFMLKRIASLSLFLFVICSCKQEETLFKRVNAKKSGIDFVNTITINDTINILENEFTYNGAGVAVGDLNGDGLQDVYFAGNQVPNKLYLNKGDLTFQEVTDVAGAQKKTGQWSSGVTFVDLNADGKQDIYVCNTMIKDSLLLRDLLFVNQGNDEKGIPHFKEMGEEYGIKDDTHNSITTFFDYDLDGDLDMFVAVNFIDMQYPNQFLSDDQRRGKGSATKDLLFRNDYDSTVGHAVFTDVSEAAGIEWGGYSHSALIHDFNKDGYPDIYVANDYLSNDIIYINNKNGTFSNKIDEMFKHQSYSSMGSDVADINNDGEDDLFAVEMLPTENKRKKVNMNANNYNHYLFTEQYQYGYQFVRNTFQVYQGMNPKTQLPLFSDVAFIAGVEATDWSWSPLLADFDNDGYRDLLITNGFPKDIIDHDFGAFRRSISSSLITRAELLGMIPEVKIPNFIFRNERNLKFSDVSKEWGISLPSFTNGTAYADFDNDGDLDIVTNNIDDPAFLFENTLYDSNEKNPSSPNYLRVSLDGPTHNPHGYGAVVNIWYTGQQQVAESHCVRGYLSKSEAYLHFGLGTTTAIDSLQIIWPGGRSQRIQKQTVNQVITLHYADAASVPVSLPVFSPFMTEVSPADFGIQYQHQENDFIDFNLQKTLPHKFSQYGPAIAVGDVNGDGLDDMVLSSSSRFQGPTLLCQLANGKFSQKTLPFKSSDQMKEEDMGLLLFDAEGDGDNDLYIVRGSYQHDPESPLYQDILCENDGKGNFKIVAGALPPITASGQNVKAADMDGDGDLDLFVGGRVAPKAYPKPGRSYLFRNDSQSGSIRFTDVTAQLSKELSEVGLVSDAVWTDFDGDGKQDLLLACEWSPLIFLRNTGSGFSRVDPQGTKNALGWWTSLLAVDMDQDGDMDYVAGNFGLNQYFKCSSGEPLRIYSKDFDQNGSYDAFISCYFPDSTGTKREYFFHSKDDMQKQLILIRRKFEYYADFGRATVKDVFTPEEMKGVSILSANFMKSVWIENVGKGEFTLHDLPNEAQLAPLYGMQSTDLNDDGLPDLLIIGNDYGMETGQGRADALNGLALLNNGNKGFVPLNFEHSGFLVPGDARALADVSINGSLYWVATQNRKALTFFRKQGADQPHFTVTRSETSGQFNFGNGRKQKLEFMEGSSFLSQKSHTYRIPKGVISIQLKDGKGNTTRTVNDPR